MEFLQGEHLCEGDASWRRWVVDGNKRTGFVAGILFLELNGYEFIASEAEAAVAGLALAGHDLEEAEYAAFLKTNTRIS